MQPQTIRLSFLTDFSSKAWKLISPNFEKSILTPIERVIDFGCGAGDTTNKLAQWIKELNLSSGHTRSKLSLTGIDICPIKTSFSQKLYGSTENPDVDFVFKTADISNRSTFSSDWKSAFYLVTSFLTVHWVKDQNQILRNIHYVLRPNGYFCIFCQTGFDGIPEKAPNALSGSRNALKHYPISVAGIGMLPKWEEYLPPGGFSEALFPGQAAYQSWGIPDPSKGFAQLAIDAGFKVHFVVNDVFSHVYQDEEELDQTFKLLTSSLIRKIPEEKINEFVKDFVREFERVCPRDENDGGKLKLNMGVIVIVGQKL